MCSRGARRVVDRWRFSASLLTGAVLFTAEASHVIMNRVFQVKLALIALGLVNVALFEVFTAPKVRDLPPLAPLPAAAKRAGVDLDRAVDRGRDLRAEHRVFLSSVRSR